MVLVVGGGCLLIAMHEYQKSIIKYLEFLGHMPK